MPEIVAIQTVDDPRDVVHRAVQLLSAGELVAFPTDTLYTIAAHALLPAAVQKLRSLLAANSHLALAVKGADESVDYVPNMSKQGRKLARRCWPGPVTIGFQIEEYGGLMRSLPDEAKEAIKPGNEVHLRVPAHGIVTSLLQLMPAPLLLSPDTANDTVMAKSAGEIAERFREHLAMIVDDGPCRYGEPSTLIHISGDQWSLEKAGIVTESTVTRLASELYVFVCTGNTCRSPMAEGLFRKLLSDKLQCRDEELINRGFMVSSAGLAAAMGYPASPESVEILRGQGIDISGHASQPLTAQLLEQADHVYTMTRSHRDSILNSQPQLADRVELLARNGSDISDPIGGGINDYANCEAQIEEHIRAIVSKIQID